jgi:ferredoxin
MTVMEKNQLLGFLQTHSQKAWTDALDALTPSIHEVDRLATRIWFAFWPLDLLSALSSAEGPDEMARLMDLEGEWRLDQQVDASVGFLFGAHYWPLVKKTVLSFDYQEGSLEETIRQVASRVSEEAKVDRSHVLGISAVGLMMTRQTGVESIEAVVDRPADGPLLPKEPEHVLANRRRVSRDGLFTFLRGVNRRWDVRWDERARRAMFRALTGQDIAMAGGDAHGDYRELDYRRIAGPVPTECRVGSCGYCWVGVVSGKENLSEMTSFERERLAYFGYDTTNADGDQHPAIRLACQSQCRGDVTLVIPPWNGELNRRHDEGRKKMGLA